MLYYDWEKDEQSRFNRKKIEPIKFESSDRGVHRTRVFWKLSPVKIFQQIHKNFYETLSMGFKSAEFKETNNQLLFLEQ